MITDSKLHRAVAEFDALTVKHAAYGASDTEPRAEFTVMLEQLYFDGDAQAPVGAGYPGWSLYSSVVGAKTIARQLTAAAKKVIKEAKADPGALRSLMKQRYGAYNY